MNSVDIEKNNRENYRTLLDVLSMPGKIGTINKLFDSYVLAIASVLLYSEVSYVNTTDEDFSIIEAITNTNVTSIATADYIFCNSIKDILQKAKKGTYLNPDYSATFICLCNSFDKLHITLKGPGIDKERIESYPLDTELLELLNENNSEYPLGNEIFFINTTNGQIIALSRTTKLELS